MNTMPTLFLSHGSPMLAIRPSPARAFLADLGTSLPRPEAIVLVSAHWESLGGPAVSTAAAPDTIHDFGGFPQALFDIRYPAPGAPKLAARIAALLESEGLAVKTSATRGLDHGAWVPLSLMYPEAGIPVTQLSLMRGATPEAHHRMGQSLRALRDEGVLVIGSGSMTHNLHEFRGQDLDAAAPGWVSEFNRWMQTRLEAGDAGALLDYRAQAPSAARNHPTEEHIAPLFVAMGAAGAQAQARRIHGSFEHSVLSMDAYIFDSKPNLL